MKSGDPCKKLPDGTDPQKFLKNESELVAGKATDLSKVTQLSRLTIKFCGHSANTTFWFTQTAMKYCNLLVGVFSNNTDCKTMTVTFKITIDLTKIESNNEVSRGIFMSECMNETAMERIISTGKEIYCLRKAIYRKDPTDVQYDMCPSDVKYTPALTVRQVQKLIKKHVFDKETREHLLNHLHGDDERISGAIRMGFTFSSARATVLAWWLAFVEQFGFGCSHTR